MATQVQNFISGNGDNPRSLVVIFLRGGADGLNLVSPLEDGGYYKSRPRIAIAKNDAKKLDGFFGLNPLLAELEPAYKAGALAVIHAVGSEDSTRSHFEAQDLMEHGGEVAGGWLGRFLRFRPNPTSGALSAIALGEALPESLRGAPSATVLRSLDEFTLGSRSAGLQRELARLYGAQNHFLAPFASDTLDALKRIEKLRATSYSAEHGAEYGNDTFAQGLKQVARLIKARVGLEAASVDLNGWDSHFNQAGLLNPLMPRLARGLAAFHRDLGRAMDSTTVVVMTEFGRRLAENSAFGTDHGRGSVMFVMGGGVQGGRVLGKWPGLTDDVLEGPGDLPVTTNYRNVLAPILERHGASGGMKKIFPEFTTEPLALYS
ncbi:MAG: DUF1501 domain-containing protein [Verrucomicrobia bacterium]|nr:DUF1501 domain-containing protein [Verrucomicrobiota bacterium]